MKSQVYAGYQVEIGCCNENVRLTYNFLKMWMTVIIDSMSSSIVNV